MGEFIVKTAQRKHVIWQSYDALSEARCVWSSPGEKLVVLGPWRSYESPFFFELIAKLTDAISCTQSKSLIVAMVIEQRVL